jgi:lipoprotein-releasing system permease protein
LPLESAQEFFNREGFIDAVHVFLDDPETVDSAMTQLTKTLPGGSTMWSWKDTAGNFLEALELEDRVMFILLAALVSIASTTILASLFVLARTKKSSIAILRTLGLSQLGVARVFFICGMILGLAGTFLGAGLGTWMSLNVDTLLALAGGDWDPSVRGIYTLPIALTPDIVLTAAGMALGLSMLSTLIPAILAARMAPVEALHG